MKGFKKVLLACGLSLGLVISGSFMMTGCGETPDNPPIEEEQPTLPPSQPQEPAEQENFRYFEDYIQLTEDDGITWENAFHISELHGKAGNNGEEIKAVALDEERTSQYHTTYVVILDDGSLVTVQIVNPAKETYSLTYNFGAAQVLFKEGELASSIKSNEKYSKVLPVLKEEWEQTLLGWFDTDTGEQIDLDSYAVKNIKLEPRFIVDIYSAPGVYENNCYVEDWETYMASTTLDMKNRELVLDSAVVTIEEKEFQYKQLLSVYIPNTVKNINADAFLQAKIEKIKIGDGVENIAPRAFRNVQYSGTKIGKIEISSGNDKYYCPEGSRMIIEKETERLVAGVLGDSLNVVIPDGVKIIGKQAFMEEYSEVKKNLILPESVVEVESDAFATNDCFNRIFVSSKLKKIDDRAFYGEYHIENLEISNELTEIGSLAFALSLIENITLNEGLKEIGSYAFYSSKITEITIPAGVEGIKTSVFQGCAGLTKVVLPDTVTHISTDAFRECSSLVDFQMSNAIKSIGSHAFSGCSSLNQITLPRSLETVQAGAFSGCSALETVTVDTVNQVFESNVFDSSVKTIIIDSVIYAPEETDVKNSFQGGLWRGATKVYVKVPQYAATQEFLKMYFEKQETSDMEGYTMWIV